VSTDDSARAAGPGGAASNVAAKERAAELLLWYPRAWRDRYGEEFAELLIADIQERPRSVARTLDVVRSGIMARFADAGLAGFPLAAPAGDAAELAAARNRQATASLAAMAAASAVFLVVGAAQWSQLLDAWVWRWRSPARGPGPGLATSGLARGATLGTTAIILVFLALAAVAAIPLLATVAARLRSPGFAGQRTLLAWPAAFLAAAAVALVIGGRSLENNWTGTGGLHSPVPGGLAAYIWAVTLFVTAYWAHPAQLAAFPAAELDWMLLCPLVIAIAVASAVLLVRRAGLSPRVLWFEVWTGVAGCAVMTAFLAIWGGYRWRAAGGSGVSLFHVGLFNEASTAVLALALLCGVQASRMALRTLRLVRVLWTAPPDRRARRGPAP
jgi:hypothetical protein